jgi:hypothetical protein
MSRVRAPVEVPEDIVARVRTLCLALPEVTVRVDGWAQSFDIRRRSFCLLMAREGPTAKPVPLLVLRADPDERAELLSVGRPFFAPRAGRDRIGVLLTDDTDWEEIRELVTESYRVLAPKKLAALRLRCVVIPFVPDRLGRRTTGSCRSLPHGPSPAAVLRSRSGGSGASVPPARGRQA